MMAMRLVRPAWLIDINEIAELKFVSLEKDAARTGACARQCVVERDPALAARVPLLAQALAWVGHAQTRNRGTVGGSLAHADPSAELPLVAQVLGARMLLRSGSGVRTLEAEKFFAGPMATTVRPGECLEEIHWPVWSAPGSTTPSWRTQPTPRQPKRSRAATSTRARNIGGTSRASSRCGCCAKRAREREARERDASRRFRRGQRHAAIGPSAGAPV